MLDERPQFRTYKYVVKKLPDALVAIGSDGFLQLFPLLGHQTMEGRHEVLEDTVARIGVEISHYEQFLPCEAVYRVAQGLCGQHSVEVTTFLVSSLARKVHYKETNGVFPFKNALHSQNIASGLESLLYRGNSSK